jgi:CelD/BcsL family acetyltransferase involved in cellulose biosynthesis
MLSVARDMDAAVPSANPVPATSAPVVRFEVASDPAALSDEWRAFERTAVGHVFQTFGFLTTWLATVGAARKVAPSIVVGRGRDGGIVCLLPFGISGCLGARLLAWLGGEHADYHGGLYAPGFLKGLADSGSGEAFVLSVLALFRGEADVVHLQRQPRLLGGAVNPFAAWRSSPYPAMAHMTRLGPSFDAYYRSKRNSSSRRHDRLKWQKLEAAAGPLEIVDAATPAEAEEILCEMFAQKRESLRVRGVPDMFARAGVPEFYRAITHQPWPEGMSHVSAIRAGGRVVAANWGLVRGSRYYYVMTSYCPGPLAAYSPGRALLYHLMGWAIERGLDEFDFTIGDEDFKAHWCEEQMSIHDSVATLTLRGLWPSAVFRVLKPAKRMVKSNPFLSRHVGRLRLAIARVRRR